MSRKNGGIIGPANSPVGGLMKGVASGVWRMNDLLDFVGNSQWPVAPQDIENSTRFNDGSSDYLTKTPSSAGNRKTWTFSVWVKKCMPETGGNQRLIACGSGTGNLFSSIEYDSSDRIRILEGTEGSSTTTNVRGAGFNRDPSAWQHVVVKYDSTQGTAADRIEIYLNGVEVSYDSTTYPSSDNDSEFNNNVVHTIGATSVGSSVGSFFDGYMAEMVLIDGQALDPTSFGEFDSTTGIWKPKKIGAQFGSGGAGTNGFYLDFKDSSNLGNDASGNNNDYTVNNLTSIDQTTDTCVENYATFNALAYFGKGSALEDGNTKAFGDSATSNNEGSFSNIPVSSGKWYAEFKIASMGTKAWIGISDVEYTILENNDAQYRPFTTMVNSDGRLDVRGSGYGAPTSTASWSASYTTNDILQVAIDLDNNYFYFGKNGTYQNSGDPTSGSSGTGGVAITSGKNYAFAFAGYGSSPSAHVNFGNPAFSISSGNADANGHGNFEYAVPSGYFSLCTKNLAEFGG